MQRAAFGATWMLVALLSFSCSSTKTTLPSPSPGVTAVNIAGNWTGTLEAAGLGTRTMSLLVVQSGNCVDGAWQTEPSEWVGAISGYADETSFSGSVSLQRPADGPGKCGGVGIFSGTATADALVWTSTGFVGECPGGLPQSVTIRLRRP